MNKSKKFVMDRQPAKLNLLHPLAKLARWKEYSEMPVGMRDVQAVVLGDKVYMGGGKTPEGSSTKLLIYNFSTDLWDEISTPVQSYSLAVYRSKLVLVGGVDPYQNTVGNKIWVLDEKHCWIDSEIPNMPTERFAASVASVGDYLIVAGGDKGGDNNHLDVVEVYDGCKWRTVQSLPQSCSQMKSIVHEEFWYLAGGVGQGTKVFYASLQSLTTPYLGGADQRSIWESLPDAPFEYSTPVIFGMQLTTMVGGNRSSIHAYSHRTKTWVHVTDLPVAYDFVCSVVLPNRELLMVGGKAHGGSSSHVFRANIQVTSFPDGRFEMSALDYLEKVALIHIFNKLAQHFLEMAPTLHFDESILERLRTENNPVEGSRFMMKAWLSSKSPPPPTWQVLLEKLRIFGMEELAQEVEDFFDRMSVTSLSASLISESKKEHLDQDTSEVESKEQQTKPDYREVGVQVHSETTPLEITENKKKGIEPTNETIEQQTKPDVVIQNSPNHQEAAVQTHDEATAAEITGYLRGVDVIAETSVLVTNQSQTFHWAGYGLKLHIPQEALPTGSEECRLLIKVGLSGQFALPQTTSLVSAVYWLDSEPRCTYSQPLTVEIQHCVKPIHSSRLSFIRAKCSQTHLPYVFEPIEGGEFSSESSYGCVQLNHFSLLGVGCNDPTSGVRLYRACLFYLNSGANLRDIHFVITWDEEPHTTVVQQEYTAKGATIGPDLSVEFESEQISLELPSENEILSGGWRMLPLFHPRITKDQVDSFKPRRRIPSCQLTAEWTKESKPSRLIHQVLLKGAKEPSNYFRIVLDSGGDRLVPHQDLHNRYPDGLESTPELQDLMNEVAAKIPSKWRDMGQQLGVDQGVLEGIAAISPGDMNRCHSNVFTRWKNQNSTTYPYTWSTIAQALKSPAVGEKRLADEIKNKLTRSCSLKLIGSKHVEEETIISHLQHYI